MVRASLQGTKTQTRIIIKPQPPSKAHPFFIVCSSDEKDEGKWRFTKNIDHLSGTVLGPIACPYGQPGDRLWVREAWGLFNDLGFCDTTLAGLTSPPKGWNLSFRADHIDPRRGDGPHQPYWRPSIHMPRWASRITLEITRVRVEKLQAISKADAIAEGIERIGGEFSCHPWRNYLLKPNAHPTEHCSSPLGSYMTLWEKINGVGSWDVNPWVWIVEFQRIEDVKP